MVPSGYGDQTRINLPRISKFVDSVTCSAYYGLQGFSLPPQMTQAWYALSRDPLPPAQTAYPVLAGVENDPWGNYVIEGHAQHVFGAPKAGLTITLMDYWVLDPEVMSRLKLGAWLPVDHDPLPPAISEALRATGPDVVPIAMSAFGRDKLSEAGFRPLYVPHSVETKRLRPGPAGEARKLFSIPEDAFLVTMVAANRSSSAPTRKGFEIAAEAFRIFMDRHDDAYLWVHADYSGRAGGIDLGALMGSLKFPPGQADSRHRAPDLYEYTTGRYEKDTYLRALYCASDVLFAPSMGEGFGVPIMEAQSCGTPVIVTDFSAMPELVGAGWKVGGRKQWTPQQSWQMSADLDDCVDALEMAYAARGDEALRGQARKFALDYDADRVADKYWRPALKALRERLELS